MKDNVLTYRPQTNDRLIQCVAADGMMRIAFIDGTNLVREAQKLLKLSRVATAALGRQLMMTAIMSADLKGERDLVSTILKGDGPAGSMICTGNSRLEVKGSVTNPDVELPINELGKLDVGGFVGRSGKLSVVSDLGLKEPYVGLSNIVSGEIVSNGVKWPKQISIQQNGAPYFDLEIATFEANATVKPRPLQHTLDDGQTPPGERDAG